MTVTVKKGKAVGKVYAPPSKSVAHRALICAALSTGSTVKNIAFSKDIKATLESLKALGANVEIDGTDVKIGGLCINNLRNDTHLPCNESGSTLRFLMPLCMCCENEITLQGTEKLFTRPLSVYMEICEKQNIYYKQESTSVTIGGVLKSGEYYVRGDISSQFITGLLFALPLVFGDSELTLADYPESKSYIDMTIKAMRDFGVEAEYDGDRSFKISGNQSYGARNLTVEGDCSNAAFFEALNLMGGNVLLTGISPDTLQGDAVYPDYFEKIKKGYPNLDITNCPDLAPILLALMAEYGGGKLTGTKRLKFKESDRGEVMKKELSKFGAKITCLENEITVENTKLHPPTETVYSNSDHRVVMSAAVLMTKYGGEIDGCEACAKSMPDFFERLAMLGGKIKI